MGELLDRSVRGPLSTEREDGVPLSGRHVVGVPDVARLGFANPPGEGVDAEGKACSVAEHDRGGGGGAGRSGFATGVIVRTMGAGGTRVGRSSTAEELLIRCTPPPLEDRGGGGGGAPLGFETDMLAAGSKEHPQNVTDQSKHPQGLLCEKIKHCERLKTLNHPAVPLFPIRQ